MVKKSIFETLLCDVIKNWNKGEDAVQTAIKDVLGDYFSKATYVNGCKNGQSTFKITHPKYYAVKVDHDLNIPYVKEASFRRSKEDSLEFRILFSIIPYDLNVCASKDPKTSGYFISVISFKPY